MPVEWVSESFSVAKAPEQTRMIPPQANHRRFAGKNAVQRLPATEMAP